MEDIIIENASLRLVVGSDCVAKSLICKTNGEECLAENAKLPLFTVTQKRPFKNEIKLSYPCKQTTFRANSLRREGDQLYVRFELVPFEAVVALRERPGYVAFALEGFADYETNYGGLKMDKPPVEDFCLLQLAIRDRENFGEWLNVCWDENTAVNVLGTAPETQIDAEERDGYRILHADVCKSIRLKGPGAALIVSPTEQLLDSIDAVEEDYDLPRGVKNRRGPHNNTSIYWVEDLTPENADTHIQYAKAGGFRMMLVYYTCMFKEKDVYALCGDYDYRPEYPNGREDLIAIVEKIKAAGLIPGFHFLQTHIGVESRYVTPVADHRLNLTRRFTLSKALDEKDATVYVEEDPTDAVMADGCRILQFGGELIAYEGYTTERPYCFTGCTRGVHKTNVQTHPCGQIGGILDVSEFCAVSVYADQNSSLPDEVAEKLADVYDCGFQFVYFDGSEGTNFPAAYHIANAQYRVYKRFGTEPILAEGAAKTHFSWHMLSGGNAFDIFKPAVFKAMIGAHPAAEAPRMGKDFTRVNFGWWAFWGAETQADMYEYGTSRAAAWDCPMTLQSNLKRFRENPRFDDVFEVIRRWEDVRAVNWLTKEQKEQLKNLEQEHILLINEQKEYELAAYNRIEGAACGDPFITAYSFTRKGESFVVYWHHKDSVKLRLPLDIEAISVADELYAEPLTLSDSVLPADKRRYVRSKLPVEILEQAFRRATVET